MVYVRGYIIVDSVSSPVGRLRVSGLPFVASGNSGIAFDASGFAATATTAIVGFAAESESNLVIDKFAAGATANLCGDCQAGTYFIFGSAYLV
jgi:hypothetical protein